MKAKLFEEFKAVPYYGNDDKPKIKYTVTLADEHGEIPYATVWNEAARTILQRTGIEVVALWENCGEPDGKRSFIDAVNGNADKDMEFTCEISAWKNNGGKFVPQLNVNRAEMCL